MPTRISKGQTKRHLLDDYLPRIIIIITKYGSFTRKFPSTGLNKKTLSQKIQIDDIKTSFKKVL